MTPNEESNHYIKVCQKASIQCVVQNSKQGLVSGLY